MLILGPSPSKIAPLSPAPAGPAVPTFRHTPAGRRFIDARKARTAAEVLGGLPAPGETWHCVIPPAKYDFFSLIDAMLVLAGPATITDLYLASLGFNAKNAGRLLELLDCGAVQRCRLLVSVYWQCQDSEADTIAVLRARLTWFTAALAHLKIIAAAFTDGRFIVAEGSANLRSCSSYEQFTVTNDRALYAFYTGILEQIHTEARRR
ncbi:MAG: hypothetical protein ABSE73_16585 [Planctomycetota bacterium]